MRNTYANPELIVEHALLRMRIEGARYTVMKQLGDRLPEVAHRLLVGDERRRDILKSLRAEGCLLLQSGFYRFAAALERASTQVHTEMIGGACVPAMMTPEEAAATLRITEGELREAIDAGKLPGVQIAEHLRVPRAELRAHLAARSTRRTKCRRDSSGRFVRGNTSAERAPSAEG